MRELVGICSSLRYLYQKELITGIFATAQQAVEKAVKVVYRAHHLEFRYTHDLAELLDNLKKKGIDIPTVVYDSIDLTEFATEARYPGFGEPVTREEYEKAVMIAKAVVQWAENKL